MPNAFAIQCEWWQTKYSAASVDKHPRQGTRGVQEHPRSEYCRDKWKNAGLYVKQFRDEPIVGWPHKDEVFKKWNRDEIQLLLEILPNLPHWVEIANYNFRRAMGSIHKGNPAASELSYGSIILYDQFFKENNKKSIIVHESSHHLYRKIAPKEIADFLSMSGWTVEVTSDGQVYESPPKRLVLPDSASEQTKLYDFFKQRYPL